MVEVERVGEREGKKWSAGDARRERESERERGRAGERDKRQSGSKGKRAGERAHE